MSETIFGAFAPFPEPVPVVQRRPEFHQEEAVPGVELNSYSRRVPSEDGTYVLIVEHNERIEKIRQPPTPEEIAERKRQDKILLVTLGSIGTVFLGILGIAAWRESKQELEAGE